jgi:UDP-N-acetylglucosamine--N-acetylmuramyl-(pentapeptide) pyrophosphoryl-undecaprenol N-acetylglucosamine transferase
MIVKARIASARSVVFAGGGTAGHLFPGLAVAERLVEHTGQFRIIFAGTGKDLERRAVERSGFEYLSLPCRPLPKRPADVLPFVLDNATGYRQATRILQQRRAATVVGLGGYASVPMGRAAARTGVPLVLLEQNAVPGRSTRWLARSATAVCVAFEQAAGRIRTRGSLQVTGNPVRRGFVKGHPRREDRLSATPSRQLLILGGSSGARTLNHCVPRALSLVKSALRNWRIVHQAGPAEWEATQSRYAALGLEATVVAFFNDMPEVLSATDLAVCRAGGTTLAELAALGVPAVLLPYPHAADNHQRINADRFAAAGGALTVDQRELDDPLEEHLACVISDLLGNHVQRAAMSEATGRLGLPSAATDVAALVRRLAGEIDTA